MEGATPIARTLEKLNLKESLNSIFTLDALLSILKLAGILVLGLIIVRIAVSLTKRLTRKTLSPRTSELLVKFVRYTGFFLIAVNLANAAGLDLSALLGAAGIAGIAIGFAAQTSISNLISGIFLLTEKAYAVGDVLDVGGGTVGVVDSIDMLSVKLKTFDNRLVRIPNETLVKSNITNVTRYPIRRLNINITITYGDDIEKARRVLMETADANPWILRYPAPIFIVDGFGESGINLFFGVWFAKDDFVDAKNSIHTEIKRRFDEENIEFAFRTVTVYQKKG